MYKSQSTFIIKQTTNGRAIKWFEREGLTQHREPT